MRLRVRLTPLATLAFTASALACSSAPPQSEGSQEALSGETPVILVPKSIVEQDVVDACAAEIDATYCSAEDATNAMQRCTDRLDPDVTDVCGASCFVAYAPERPTCQAGPSYPTPASCDSPIVDDCAFYRSCLEASHPCGADGYPLGFGERLCYAFIEDREDFSRAGQAWLRGVRTCLQRALVPVLHEDLTCSELLDEAYATHPPCYTELDNSICDLPPEDVVALGAIILDNTLLSARTIEQVHEVARACVEQAVLPRSGNDRGSGDFFQSLERASRREDTLRAFLAQNAPRGTRAATR